ncbi:MULTISPECIES: hemerythrin domain-containing protein [Actinomadura]|uniref:Hemerythrin domain-containing protein n=1 Tax=Actinomadura litoris TaxID=2678616 RepID=A0A7K1KSN0_9ACTN|nr:MULTISPECIES: hemerythrin domain-containing protein [Actinomadura]MBT2207988.1 hemerythrin domain-containing protein [Actinomadura sp. NEAU-AAG7]MUN35169.1 hemerythrin domain-containing protein [Actinomadura litoris]
MTHSNVSARYVDNERLIALNASHAAFRRDLTKMARVATVANFRDPAHRRSILNGWAVFKNQLEQHHSHEDRFIWPNLRENMANSEAAMSVLDDMESEHALIDPLLRSVDYAFEHHETADLAAVLDELNSKLGYHLTHEEHDAIPMIVEAIPEKEWKKIVSGIKKASMSGAPEFMPWVTEGATDGEVKRILSMLPPPARLIYRRVWVPKYRKVSRW